MSVSIPSMINKKVVPFFARVGQKKSVRDYVLSLGGQGFARLFSIAGSILIARTMGPEDFGAYTLFFAIVIFVFEVQTGVNVAYVRFARAHRDRDKKIFQKIVFLIQLLASSILILLGWPLALLLSDVLAIDNPLLFFWGFLCGGFASLYRIWFGIFQEDGRFEKLAVSLPAFNFLVVVLLGLLWILPVPMTLNHIFSLYLLVAGITGIASSLLFVGRIRRVEIDRTLFVSMLKMTSMNVAITLSFFLYRLLDVFFVKYFLDLESVGLYSAALRTSMFLGILASSTSLVLLPRATAMIGSFEAVMGYLRKAYAMAFMVLLVFLVFFFFSPVLLQILYGDEYLASEATLKLLVLGWSINVLYIPMEQLYYALNKVGWRLSIEISRLVIACLLFTLLIPAFGTVGSALSLLAAISVSFVLSSAGLFFIIKSRYFCQLET